MLLYWKKSSPDDSFETPPLLPAAKSAAFAACLVALLRPSAQHWTTTLTRFSFG